MHSFKRSLERLSVRLVPSVATVIMLIVSAVMGHIPGMVYIMPLLTLASIYYWCIFYPGTLPYWFLFFLGILQDTLSGMPLGFSSLLDMLFALIVIKKFRVFTSISFSVVWSRFVTLSLAFVLVTWFLASLFQEHGVVLQILLLQWAATCLTYPFVHFILTHVWRAAND